MGTLSDLASGALNMLGDARPGISQAVQMLEKDKQRKMEKERQNAYIENMKQEAMRGMERSEREQKQLVMQEKQMLWTQAAQISPGLMGKTAKEVREIYSRMGLKGMDLEGAIGLHAENQKNWDRKELDYITTRSDFYGKIGSFPDNPDLEAIMKGDRDKEQKWIADTRKRQARMEEAQIQSIGRGNQPNKKSMDDIKHESINLATSVDSETGIKMTDWVKQKEYYNNLKKVYFPELGGGNQNQTLNQSFDATTPEGMANYRAGTKGQRAEDQYINAKPGIAPRSPFQSNLSEAERQKIMQRSLGGLFKSKQPTPQMQPPQAILNALKNVPGDSLETLKQTQELLKLEQRTEKIKKENEQLLKDYNQFYGKVSIPDSNKIDIMRNLNGTTLTSIR